MTKRSDQIASRASRCWRGASWRERDLTENTRPRPACDTRIAHLCENQSGSRLARLTERMQSTHRAHSTPRCHSRYTCDNGERDNAVTPRASAQGPALPRGPALRHNFFKYVIHRDHQLQSSVRQKCHRLLRRKHNAQTPVCLCSTTGMSHKDQISEECGYQCSS